jgi:ABC-type sugar transport system ATPase subunit
MFAATFVGEPSMNTLPAEISESAGQFFLSIGRIRISIDKEWMKAGNPLTKNISYIAGIRPQQLELVIPDNSTSEDLRGSIFAVETLGSRVIFDIDVDGSMIRVVTTLDYAKKFPDEIGASIAIKINPDFVYLFDSTTGRTIRQARFALRSDN